MPQHLIVQLLPLGLPLFHALAAIASMHPQLRRHIGLLTSAAFGSAVIAAVAMFANTSPAAPALPLSPAPASHVIAILIGFLGLVITRFSRRYLMGESGQGRYSMWLHTALATVAAVVITDHLAVLLLGWIGISLALNELLLFFPDRPRAKLAAHKKFLFARLAELALLIATGLLVEHHGTWHISEMMAAYPATIGPQEQLAALLIAVAALIKCAQLPLHGWLIQVVEAPTPVSALLHAGIINLGGYLLILFGPLMLSSAPASWLLIIIAGLSLMLSSLIMTTRVSIKVKLAWSTVAQMGLMLIECALGLFELALVHLVSHACYKAWLFLRAGSAVQMQLNRGLGATRSASAVGRLVAIATAVALCYLLSQLLTPTGPISPWLLLAALAAALLTERSQLTASHPPGAALAMVVVLLSAYMLQKTWAGQAFTGIAPAVSGLADTWIAGLIALMCATWALMTLAPMHASARRLSRWLFAGLYLDEWATRLTLKLWPMLNPQGKNRTIQTHLPLEAD